MKCSPENTISIIEADLNLEFEAPQDYKEVPLKKTQSKIRQDEDNTNLAKAEQENYENRYKRIDGKAITKK